MYFALFTLLGLSFGSFGNVLVARVPNNESVNGRSKCPHCKHTLGIVELIPVLSFMVQRGRCRSCGARIGMLYPVVELLGAAVFVLAAYLHQDVWVAMLLALALWLLLIISVIDLRTRTISDGLNIPFIASSIAYSVVTGQFALSGMVLMAAFFGSLWLAGRGKWIGSGDVILAIGIGGLLGSWRYAFASLMLTYILGALIILSLLLSRIITKQHYVAFAPFLTLGAYIVVCLRPEVEQVLFWYFGI